MGGSFRREPVRRKGITITCVVTILLLIAVRASPSSAMAPGESGLPAPAPQEVASFAKGFAIPAAKAEEEIEIQTEEAQLPQEVRHVLGNHYAGIWFDDASGEFVVPVPNRASARTVEGDVAAQAGNLTTEEVKSTWGELENQQRSLMARLRATVPAGTVDSSLDAEANQIQFDVSAALDPTDLNSLERIVGSAAVATSVDQGAASTLQFGDLSCQPAYRICGAPMRGGTWWGYPYTGGISHGEVDRSCSVGFPMIGNTFGNRFMLTAGHCIAFSEKEAEVVSTKAAWAESQATPQEESREIGPLQAYRNATNSSTDWALFNANGGYWDNGTATPTIAAWGGSEEYEILSEGSSYLGQNMCHSGASSGVSCGPVVATDVTGEVENLGKPVRIEHMTEFGPVCAAEGDSGGPVYSGHTAFGVVSSDTETEKMGCNHYVLYPEITQIAEEAEIHVGPKVGQKPVVRILSTEPATFNAGAVELEGTVDANGIETDYHFDYGPTTAYGQSSPGGDSGSGYQPVPVTQSLEGLPGSSTFHYRLTAQNSGGTVMTGDYEFTTPAWPTVIESHVEAAAKSAVVTGAVEGNGSETEVFVEYGPTTSYGTKSFIGEASPGQKRAVDTRINGLAAGATYHVRITAKNGQGPVVGGDQIVTTVEPPAAPVSTGVGPIVSEQGVTEPIFQGEFVSAHLGEWSQPPAPYEGDIYEVRMLRCNSTGHNCVQGGDFAQDPYGAVATFTNLDERPRYHLEAGDVGHALVMEETVRDEGGSTTVLSAPSSVVVARGATLDQVQLASTAAPTKVVKAYGSNLLVLDAPSGRIWSLTGPAHEASSFEAGFGDSLIDLVDYEGGGAWFTSSTFEGYGSANSDGTFLEHHAAPIGSGSAIAIASDRGGYAGFYAVPPGSDRILVSNHAEKSAPWTEIAIPGSTGKVANLAMGYSRGLSVSEAAYFTTEACTDSAEPCLLGEIESVTNHVVTTEIPFAAEGLASESHYYQAGSPDVVWLTVDQPRSLVMRCVFGKACQEFPLPEGARPGAIVEGPDLGPGSEDGDFWFVEEGTDEIGVADAKGIVAQIPLASRPAGIVTDTAESGQPLWVTEPALHQVLSLAP